MYPPYDIILRRFSYLFELWATDLAMFDLRFGFCMSKSSPGTSQTPGNLMGHLAGIFPRSLRQLSKQLRDQNNNPKPQKHEVQNLENNEKKYIFLHFGGFQAFGGVPGEDFDMQNPNLRSKMMENSPQRGKRGK